MHIFASDKLITKKRDMKKKFNTALFILAAFAIIVTGTSCKKVDPPVVVEEPISECSHEYESALFRPYQVNQDVPYLDMNPELPEGQEQEFSDMGKLSLHRFGPGLYYIEMEHSYEYESLSGTATRGDLGTTMILKSDVNRFYLYTYNFDGDLADGILDGTITVHLRGRRQ